MKKIGIVVIATNSYFVLGVRFMKKFMHHYKGNSQITFYFFSDTDPTEYVENIRVSFIRTTHTNWVEGTNSKFTNIISLEGVDEDYLYYFDADTNVSKDFTEAWFIGSLVGGEHYANNGHMKYTKAYDRNPKSKAYIPYDTPLHETYYYGAFFGGDKGRVIEFCKVLKSWQEEDKKINYEPAVNDESYINKYFHYNSPNVTVPCTQFKFDISDKGGLGETRRMDLSTAEKKEAIKCLKDKLFDIRDNKIVLLD